MHGLSYAVLVGGGGSGLKFQLLQLPDGLKGNMAGPYPGRYHPFEARAVVGMSCLNAA